MEVFAFLNWEILATFTGAVGLTVIIVQMLKLPIDKVWKIPTRYLVYVVCLVIMLLAQYFIGKDMSLETIVITVINAILGTLAAMALYEQIIELPEQKKFAATYGYLLTGQTGLVDSLEDGSTSGTASVGTTTSGKVDESADDTTNTT